MTSTIEKIVDRLKNYPGIEYETTEYSVTVQPKDDKGFPVTLTAQGENTFTVAFDFWHEEFEKEEEALNCFTFGLTKACRLKLSKRGQRPYKWTVEYNEAGTWKEESTTGFFNLAFWKSTTVDYLQNDLIENEK